MKLVIEQGEGVGQAFRLSRPLVVIGRAQDADITLGEHGVSRQHARLERGPQGWTVTDLGTTNGTFVNGRQLSPHESVPIQPGDRLSIGSSVLALQQEEALQEGPPAAAGGRRSFHPLISIAGAILFLLLLAGVVALLVALLQPGEATIPTPTQGNPIEQLITAVPVPTQMQEIIPSVMPLIPTELHLFPPDSTSTPPPPAAGGVGAGGKGIGP